MNIYVDADASPVQKETISIAREFNLHVYLIKSFAHYSYDKLPSHVEVIYVDHGADMADFAIVKRVQKNDIVITQDYGLASICLAKGCHVLHHKGFIYTNNNIDRLLSIRHANALARKAGKRTKGPRPFSDAERKKFITTLTCLISNSINNE